MLAISVIIILNEEGQDLEAPLLWNSIIQKHANQHHSFCFHNQAVIFKFDTCNDLIFIHNVKLFILLDINKFGEITMSMLQMQLVASSPFMSLYFGNMPEMSNILNSKEKIRAPLKVAWIFRMNKLFSHVLKNKGSQTDVLNSLLS